jgi:hypothetical protein
MITWRAIIVLEGLNCCKVDSHYGNVVQSYIHTDVWGTFFLRGECFNNVLSLGIVCEQMSEPHVEGSIGGKGIGNANVWLDEDLESL